jgi:hypothetical protein
MVNTYLLPSILSAQALSPTGLEITIIEVTRPIGTSKKLLIKNNGKTINIKSDYVDVAFKFECFGLTFEIIDDLQDTTYINIIRMQSLSTIKMLARYEWERPALTGEVQPERKQSVRQCGKRSQIPDSASLVCLSFIGLLFIEADTDNLCTIIQNDEDPILIEYSENLDLIKDLTENTDAIDIKDYPHWLSTVISSKI